MTASFAFFLAVQSNPTPLSLFPFNYQVNPIINLRFLMIRELDQPPDTAKGECSILCPLKRAVPAVSFLRVYSSVLPPGQATRALRPMLVWGARAPDGECESRLNRWSRGLAVKLKSVQFRYGKRKPWRTCLGWARNVVYRYYCIHCG
jgi:hypothetical protein